MKIIETGEGWLQGSWRKLDAHQKDKLSGIGSAYEDLMCSMVVITSHPMLLIFWAIEYC